MPKKSLHWLLSLPQMQVKMFNTEGGSDNEEKTLGHGYSGTIQREGGEHQILRLGSHKLENPTSPTGEAPLRATHFLPYHPVYSSS